LFWRNSNVLRLSILAAVLAGALLARPQAVAAQLQDPMQGVGVRPDLLKDVGIDQKLNDSIPLDLKFRDEHGKPVELAQYFGSKPVILSLVYYNCPMLCSMASRAA
jgi:protein SCO1/2